MDVELTQIDRRYEALRTRSRSRERKLLASLSEVGQQSPIIVVRDAQALVLVDGYKRVRALARLAHDTASAIEWTLGEADALLLERLLRGGDADSAIEQGWFLRELSTRFGLGLDEIARRFDRSKSWVSRRIALVHELPDGVQAHVRDGAIGAHAAMRHLVPLARANADHCVRLADMIAPLRLSNRQIGELYATYASATADGRALLLRSPMVVLNARAEIATDGGETPVEKLLEDLQIAAAIVRRAHTRLVRGAVDGAPEETREAVRQACGMAHSEIERFKRRCDREVRDVGSDHTGNDLPTS